MPPTVCEWPWTDYIFHPFPVLSSSKNSPSLVGRIELTHNLHPNIRDRDVAQRQLLWAAIVKLTTLYVDAPEFVFAEIQGKQPISAFKVNTTAIQQVSTWADLATSLDGVEKFCIPVPRARAALELADSVNPYPVIIAWDSLPPELGDVDGPAVVLEIGTRNGKKEELVIAVRWNHLILSPNAAQVFLRQTLALFDVAAADSSRTASTIDLDPTLTSIIKANFNPAEAFCATDWLVRNAIERPDAIAHEIYADLSSPPHLLTYAELNTMANKLARWLRSSGLDLEDRVALCRSKDLQFYVAHAAIFKSGACYVSIDPELPEERKCHIAEDSDAKFILTSDAWFESFKGPVYSLDSPTTLAEIDSQDSSEISLAKLDSLAYLLYTSGTTGKPKGCLLNHRGIYWAIKAICEYPREVSQPDTDKRLALASVAFDVHISEICQVWCLGIRLVTAPRFEVLADLQNNIIRLGITNLAMVPSMIEATLTAPEDLPLKYLASGGEKISDAVLETWADNPNIILANFYGPTEVTIGCVSRKVSAEDRKENIGKPFPACSAYIVNSEMEILPLGVAGELVIGGPLVGRGYHRLPEVTANSFKEWPTKGCRAYRTGDLVRMTAEGNLLIHGRIDSQIKLRGVRIESEGVSEIIRQATRGRSSAHTLISSHPELGNEILVSFFANDDPSIKVHERRTSTPKILLDRNGELVSIRNAVQIELAVYMRPSHIVPLNFLPLTLNGKIDGNKLLGVFKQTRLEDLMRLQLPSFPSQAISIFGGPTDIESRVINHVSTICGLPVSKITPASNLFECGLDSLEFSSLAQALRREFANPLLSVSSIMQSPEIEAIAKLCSGVEEDLREKVVDSTWLEDFSRKYRPLVQQVFRESDIEQVLPTLPIQDGILAQSMQFDNLYVQHFLYRCKSGVDLDRLKNAWREVVQRQEILRVGFVLGPETLQVVFSLLASTLPWILHDIEEGRNILEMFGVEEGPRIARDINDDITTPLFRLNLYRSPHSSYLAVSIHHAIYDGVAFPLLMKQVDAAYGTHSLQDVVQLSEVVRHIVPASRDNRTEEFWVSELQGIQLHDRSLHQRNEHHVVRYAKLLDVSLQHLRSRCSAIHVTLEALFAGAIAYLGRRFLEWSNDVIFGIIHSGRINGAIDLSSAIAPLVSVVPLRVQLQQGKVAGYLQSCRSSINRLLPHEHVPLGTIQRWIGATALVDVLFSTREEISPHSYECLEYIPLPPPPPEFPIVFEIVVNTASDTVEIRSAVAVNEEVPKTVQQLVDEFESWVTYLSESPDGDLSFLDTGDRPTPGESMHQSGGKEGGSVDSQAVETVISELYAFLRIPTENVREDSTLLSLGLDSLKAVALSQRLRERGLFISPVDVVRAGSVRGIVSASTTERQQGIPSPEENGSELEQLLQQDLPPESIRLDIDDQIEITAATALQAGLLSQTIASSGQLYVHAFTFELQQSCQIELLKEAWRTSVQNLDILRTSFHFSVEVGRWAQVVHSSLDFKWTFEKRQSIDSAAKDFIRDLHFGAEDALHRPPVHLRHVSLSPHENYLIVVLHHALYDGISLPMLFNHVKAVYKGDSPFAPQFYTLARRMTSIEARATGFWQSRLKGVHPWKFPRRVFSTADAWRTSKVVNVPKEIIDRFCRRYGVSAQSIAQAAWAKVLAVHCRCLDVVYGHVVSGRMIAGSENIIGPMFNTIPCRVTIGQKQTGRDLVRSVHKLNLEALPWHHASLRSIQRALGAISLCDTLFLFQPNTQEEDEQDPLWTLVSQSDERESKSQYAINIEIHPQSDSWVIRSSCSAAVMDIPGLEEILTEYEESIAQIVNRPGDPVMPTGFLIVESPKSSPGIDHDSVCEDRNWEEHKSAIIRGLLSRFSKLPESLIRGSTSLASMGIDSITAMQIASLARKQGVYITPVTIIQCTNVHELLVKAREEEIEKSSGLDSAASSRHHSIEIPSPLADVISTIMPRHVRQYIEAIYPVSSGMEWMIGAWQNSGGHRYQHAFVHRVHGRVDIQLLERSWDALLRFHPILRSTFCPVPAVKENPDHLLALCVLDTLPGDAKRLSCRKLPDSQNEEQALGAEVRMSVMHPPATPGIHARLTVLEGIRDSYLLFNLHHFQYDAGSLPILIRHLEALYLGLAFHCESNVGSHLKSLFPTPSKGKIQEKYWRELFPLGWQPDFFARPPPFQKNTRANHLFRGVVSSLDKLRETAKKSDLTLQAILLAAWACVHSLECSASEATFGIWHSSRFTENLAIPCLNLLPMRVVDTRRPILEVSKGLMKDLQRRTGILEQSKLRDVSRWAGLEGKPLCNVYVNVLHPGLELSGDPAKHHLFEPVKLPYRVSELANENSNRWKGAFSIPEIQDDVMIEIFFDNAKDSIGMSIESSVLTERQSKRLVTEWGRVVTELIPREGKNSL
ncbi:hypothetical protein BJ322DRAFT_1067759 [Thelephora terrestris]|uniref:Carrier domain-containing protein n=1 Tax=Thelephora terrestris TaxID=56493 RepID=A0A9P6L5A9_9AGAM|nr:hypothetical protein BJ322DRAFT_1067759 [Thelephora terrestris]